MKRFLCIALALFLLCALSGCAKRLPHPPFPLAEETLMREVAASGFSWVLSKDETQSYQEGHIAYVLRDPTEKPSEEAIDTRLWASVSSAVVEGERELFLIFVSAPVSTNHGKTPLVFSWEDWRAQLLLAARLYGGFSTESALYDAFAAQELPADAQSFAYEAFFPNAYCRVSYRTRDTHVVHGFPEATALAQAGMLRVNLYESEAAFQREQAASEAKKAEWERAKTDEALREKLIRELEARRAMQEQRRAELFD